MICPRCGNSVNGAARRCGKCGHLLGSSTSKKTANESVANKAASAAKAFAQTRQSGNSSQQAETGAAAPHASGAGAPHASGTAATHTAGAAAPHASDTPTAKGGDRAGGAGSKLIGAGIVVAIIVLLFFIGSRAVSCVSGAGKAAGGAGGAIALNADTRAAEDAVMQLVDAVKRGDENAISRQYLGDVSDLLAASQTSVLVTDQGFYDSYDAFKSAFAVFASFNGKKPQVENKINDKLHAIDCQVTETMPLGNMLSKDLEGARIRARIDRPYVRWAEEYAEFDMADSLVVKLGEKGMETALEALIGEYRDYKADDWVEKLAEDTKEWIEDSVDFYYTALDKRLDEAPLMSEQSDVYIDFIAVNDGGTWKVAPMEASDLYDLWGGFTGKFGRDTPNETTRYPAAAEYLPETAPTAGVAATPSGYDGGRLEDARDAEITESLDASVTNAKFGKDSVGRWMITGEVENIGADGSTVMIFASGTGTNLIGNPFENSNLESDTATPGMYTGNRSETAVVANMKKGERRSFALYPVYETGSGEWEITDLQKVSVGAVSVPSSDSPEDLPDLVDGVEVSVESVSYDLLGATTISPSLVVCGRMKNTTRENVDSPMPVFVFTGDGAPLPALNKEGDGTVFGVAATGTKSDGRTTAPASLAPGEEAEFKVHCELNESTADEIFLHGVASL